MSQVYLSPSPTHPCLRLAVNPADLHTNLQLTFWLVLGHALSLQTYPTITGLCLTLVTVTGPDLWPCLADWLLSFPSNLPRHHKLAWRSGLSGDCCCHHRVCPACLTQDWAVAWQGPCPSSLTITVGSQLPIP